MNSEIGLDPKMSKEDAYVNGTADGEKALLINLRNHAVYTEKQWDDLNCTCGWTEIPSPVDDGWEQYCKHLEKEYL